MYVLVLYNSIRSSFPETFRISVSNRETAPGAKFGSDFRDVRPNNLVASLFQESLSSQIQSNEAEVKVERAEHEAKLEDLFAQLTSVKKSLATSEESGAKSEQQLQEKSAKIESLGKSVVKLESELQAKVRLPNSLCCLVPLYSCLMGFGTLGGRKGRNKGKTFFVRG